MMTKSNNESLSRKKGMEILRQFSMPKSGFDWRNQDWSAFQSIEIRSLQGVMQSR